VSIPFPRTFDTFSKFHLNTQKSANIKVVRLFKGHTFHNWRHLRIWVEVVQKHGQRQPLHVCRTQKKLFFTTRSRSILSPKHLSTFTEGVTLCTIYNFRIQSFWCTVQLFGANHGPSLVDQPPLALWRAGVTLRRRPTPARAAAWWPQGPGAKGRCTTW
jgi:hypothetical protein